MTPEVIVHRRWFLVLWFSILHSAFSIKIRQGCHPPIGCAFVSHRAFGRLVVNEEQLHGSDEVRPCLGWRDRTIARDGAAGQGGACRWQRVGGRLRCAW